MITNFYASAYSGSAFAHLAYFGVFNSPVFSVYSATTIREAVSHLGASMWWRAWEANSAVKNSGSTLCFLCSLLLDPNSAVKNFLAFSESHNPFNQSSHCDIAWAGALATHAHLTNKPVLTARLG